MSFLSDGIDPRRAGARFAAIAASHLGFAHRISLQGDSHELLGHHCRILLTAVDCLPSTDLRLSGRRMIARDNALAAVVLLHPAWDIGWTSETRAYVAFPQDGSIVAADMMDASVGWSSEGIEFLSCTGDRRLYIDSQGSRLLPPLLERAWSARRSAAGLVWQDAVADASEAA